MKTLIARTSRGLGLLFLSTLALFAATAAEAANIIIVNNNAAGVGFNDPTPVAPVGGNPGTTLGAQRLNVFNYAASIWGGVLPSAALLSTTKRPVPRFVMMPSYAGLAPLSTRL